VLGIAPILLLSIKLKPTTLYKSTASITTLSIKLIDRSKKR